MAMSSAPARPPLPARLKYCLARQGALNAPLRTERQTRPETSKVPCPNQAKFDPRIGRLVVEAGGGFSRRLLFRASVAGRYWDSLSTGARHRSILSDLF